LYRYTVMQAGFVLSISDLALAAAIMAHAHNNPTAWRVPRGDDDGDGAFKPPPSKKKGDGGDFLASINAKPPRGLFAWSQEELVRTGAGGGGGEATAGESFLILRNRIVVRTTKSTLEDNIFLRLSTRFQRWIDSLRRVEEGTLPPG
jgi:hypothetical protein